MRALLAALLLALPASAETIGWRTDVTDGFDTFELCTDAGCDAIGYSRWHAPLHQFGDVYVYRADVELAPGVRHWIRARTLSGVAMPINPIRIWCSPWDFSGDGFIGIIDYLRWMIGGFEGGLEGRTNLSAVYAERCR